jgi:hypothetical protein
MREHLLHTIGDRLRRTIRRMLSPTFLAILLSAATLWYASKLNRSYDTEMALDIRIDGQKYRLTTIVTGRGSAILARKLSLKRAPRFTLEELSPRTSRKDVGAYSFAPASLQKAINDKTVDDDFVVISVTDAPEFVPQSVDEKKDRAATDKKGETEKPSARRSSKRSGQTAKKNNSAK